MAISENYLNFVLEQLSCMGNVTSKKMFGGAMIYLNRKPFALIADDVLYFKVDDSNRADYEAAGMEAFKPFAEKSYVMSYYEVPIDVLENSEELKIWATKALSAAKKKSTGHKKKKEKI